MSLARLVFAWAAVAAWFVLWEATMVRLGLATPGTGGGRLALRAPARVYAGEALLLVLFAALWFGSLGSGGWWLLFGVLGLLIEGPVRARHSGWPAGSDTGKWILYGVLVARMVSAGGLLAWRLG